ncbi:Hypothetical predicted protein [Xyrichtys novacula]|uniref:Uncharacterized protein n=1 Tax=Xyrichtys novacula TaxID=13765 RepID=A0AAV1HEU1_XYRNO|nr:Hypothetical predicted protein [Xyrichtys novacula]
MQRLPPLPVSCSLAHRSKKLQPSPAAAEHHRGDIGLKTPTAIKHLKISSHTAKSSFLSYDSRHK